MCGLLKLFWTSARRTCPSAAAAACRHTPDSEAVADRLLIHYRLHVTQGATRWVCTQTAICKTVDGLLAVIDLLCSGFREVRNEHVAA
jgi:hypothetical protein